MMTSNLSTAMEQGQLMDVEQRSSVNFGISEGLAQLYDRF